MQRLKEKYLNQIRQKLQQELGLKSSLEVPHVEKIVISMGLGDAKDNSSILEKAKVYLAAF